MGPPRSVESTCGAGFYGVACRGASVRIDREEREMRIRNTKLYLARRSQAVQDALKRSRESQSAAAARGPAARKAAARKAAATKRPEELADEAV
jgi:hypothetical protein